MVLNIAIPFPSVRKDIFSSLQKMEMPSYKFIKWISPYEGQFEVEDDGSHGDLVRFTKKFIQQTKYGKVIMFRVLINGQFFENGVIREDLKK